MIGLRFVAACLFAAAVAAPAHAQRKASEIATVSQTVDGTVMTLEYYRPVARGRELFGSLVRWGQVWTPGANWATTFEADKDVEINGNLVPKGKYSIWMIPRESENWTVIFHRKARAFHVDRPKEGDQELFRVAVKPEQGDHMETLMWYFPVVGPDGATLRMHWGKTFVPLQVSIRPTVVATTLQPTDRALYVGGYSFDADWAKDATLQIADSAGRFIATLNQPRMPEPTMWGFVPLGEHKFSVGRLMAGQVVDQTGGSTVRFQLEDGKVVGFEMRDADGKVEARGKRKN